MGKPTLRKYNYDGFDLCLLSERKNRRMHTCTAKCKIGTVKRAAWNVVVQQQCQTGLAFIITVAMAGFCGLKGALFQEFIRGITLFKRLFLIGEAEKCLCRCRLALELMCHSVGKYG